MMVTIAAGLRNVKAAGGKPNEDAVSVPKGRSGRLREYR
jgi:hypothetical protein